MTCIRGSRKHILDVLSQPNHADIFTDLLQNGPDPQGRELHVSNGIKVTLEDPHQPKGWPENAHKLNKKDIEKHPDSREMQLREFLPKHFGDWGTKAADELDEWCLAVKPPFNTPVWDLLWECQIDEHDGIILVEAKAHENELKRDGKVFNATTNIKNHLHIGMAIHEARLALDAKVPGVNICRDSHYQLANRVAWSWKLAEMGLHVILVYLGFLGDEGIADVGQPFRDGEHWQRVMGGYMHGVLPQSFPEQRLKFGSGSMIMMIRSLPI